VRPDEAAAFSSAWFPDRAASPRGEGRPFLCRCKITGFNRLSHCRSDGIEIHIRGTRQYRRFIQQPNGSITSLPELPDFLVLTVGSLSNVLTQQSHPPRDVAQSAANSRQLVLVVDDTVDFEFRRFQRTTLFVTPLGTEHQPATSHLFVAPLLHHIRARPQDQVNVIGHDRLTQQINAKVFGLMHELLIDPELAMVIVLSGDRIVSQQKTPPHRAIHDMHDRNFVRRKHFHPSQSCHASPQSAVRSQKAEQPAGQVYKNNAACQQNAVSPVIVLVHNSCGDVLLGQTMDRVVGVASKRGWRWLGKGSRSKWIWDWKKNGDFLYHAMKNARDGKARILDIGFDPKKNYFRGTITLDEFDLLTRHGFSRRFTGEFIMIDGRWTQRYEWIPQ
jgi:hypothetical protein